MRAYRHGFSTKTFSIFCCLLLAFPIFAQDLEGKGDVYVDEAGVMRWGLDNSEVKGFGINYTVPFAHAYRTAKKKEVDIKEAIANDVYHFSRLDFDLFRVHVWDTEISDEEGNLLENEHLELFDYLLKQLKDRDINFVITPIAFWGNGWPEPDEDTPGFSNKYGKENSLTDPAAIKAQENYLYQFLNHVNPYTGVAYKDEPNIIAFEVSNEPHHKGSPEEVKEFIAIMLASMKRTGTKKPIFYNSSHSVHLAESYFDAGIDGGTFQWYPTGLGFQKELEGNLLPNVNDYNIPFDEVIKENGGAKLVYEFDAADVNKSYMYPAMARSFREAGIQIATHFSYDPTYMAEANTEYNTHFMNLAYAPRKALALMISGKIFHELPMYRDQGSYPENLEFGNFSISYPEDLAIYNSGKEFIYTNDNYAAPKAPTALNLLAGYGSSKIVKYEGRGAYFLDKLEEGVWRLEVMPDALVVDNLFGKNSPDKSRAVINWKPWEMSIMLPGLGDDFQVKAINENNNFTTEVKGGSFEIFPGTYILVAKGTTLKVTGEEKWKGGRLNEFSAPASQLDKTFVLHQPLVETSASTLIELEATILSDEKIVKIEAWLQNANSYESVELTQKSEYTFSAAVPEILLTPGFLRYTIVIFTEEGSYTFPGRVEGNSGEWDFSTEKAYVTRIVEKETPLTLFDALTDYGAVVGEWRKGNQLVPGATPGKAEYQVRLESLFEEDVENRNAAPIYDYSFRYNFLKKIEGRKEALLQSGTLVLEAKSLSGTPEKLQLALVDSNGSSFGKVIEIIPGVEEYKIPISELKPAKTVTLPRPYPSFLPYYFDHNNKGTLEIKNVESLQFSIGPGMDKKEQLAVHALGITQVRLEK